MARTAPNADVNVRPFTFADIATIRTVASLDMSPSGHATIYVRREIADDRSKLVQSLWLINLGSGTPEQCLAHGIADVAPVWSPDSQSVAFVRASKSSGNEIVSLRVEDGSETILAVMNHSVRDLRWSPDGRSLAFVTGARTETLSSPALEPGVNIFTRANYRTDGGYVDYRNPPQIWIVGAGHAKAPPRRLTMGGQPAKLIDWTSNSRTILYSVNETDEPYYGDGRSGLYEVDVSSGASRKLRALKTITGERDIGSAPQFRLSPNGRELAFVASAPDAPPGFAQSDVFILDLASGETRSLTADLDEDLNDAGLVWTQYDRVLVIARREGAENLIELDASTGRIVRRTQADQAVHGFSVSRDGRSLVAALSTGDSPPEVYDVSNREARRLTGLNVNLRAQTNLQPPESVWFTASDGVRVHSFLQLPSGFDPAKRYPLIVWNHGGPFYLWTAGFNGDVQAMAGAGYIVLYPNPRGSQSYGQAFASALAPKWPGGRDYEDVMEAVDHIVQRPYVDDTRLGIAGTSAGGIMTDWAITRSTRFKAAVSVSDIADNRAYWFIGDQPSLGPNARLPDRTRVEDSVIDRLGEVVTPTLFISGERDYRTPSAAGGELMFRGLKLLRVPTALMLFETAGHSIYTSEYPEHPSLKIKYLLRWMDRYLKDAPAPEFDVAAPME